MTHADAVTNQAADKYLLSELSLEEREQFEEHFFSCPECAAEVKAGAAFAANVREVLTERTDRRTAHRPADQPKVRGLLGWRRPALALSLACASLFAIVNVVLLMRLHHLDAPQAYPAFFLRGTARGDEQVLHVPRTARFAGLSVDVPPGRAVAGYRATLLDPAGHALSPIDLPAPPEAGTSLNVLVPVSGLASGTYTLVLEGGGVELGRFPFLLELH